MFSYQLVKEFQNLQNMTGMINAPMSYLCATKFILLIIMSDGKYTIIYIDGAHTVYSNCKGHSGLFVTQGKRAMISISKKLVLVSNISTEIEIVAIGNEYLSVLGFAILELNRVNQWKKIC